LQLNDLLKEKGIDPFRDRVLVLRHRPHEQALRRKFLWIAGARPELFNAYQSTQGATVENALQKARYLASFVGHEPRKAVFIGLYKVGRAKALSFEAYWRNRAHRELRDLGMTGFGGARKHILKFRLDEIEDYRIWKGKLIVDWPGSDRAWSRWANKKKNSFSVSALLEDSKLNEAMPDWRDIVFRHGDLRILPQSWRDKMSQWRGIYFVFDESQRRGYVGSAYGRGNILDRWMYYSKTGHGGNKLLKQCNEEKLSFSILEILRHDQDRDDVIRLEQTWMKRLHTREPFGLNAKVRSEESTFDLSTV
jgi:hypothetical protein